jgi:hypothetical protein
MLCARSSGWATERRARSRSLEPPLDWNIAESPRAPFTQDAARSHVRQLLRDVVASFTYSAGESTGVSVTRGPDTAAHGRWT